jgi:hypothetical protein
VWFGILVLANINGAARQAWLIPRLGEPGGRVVSTLALSGVVLLLTWLTIPWLGLTLAFEFLVGHYVFGQSWRKLLEDYDITRGRIWALVLLLVLFAPLLTARSRGLL